MFFKKNAPGATQNQMQGAQAEAHVEAPTNAPQDTSAPSSQAAKPVYQKPVLRRYDQIEQVKPYGPSEI